MRFFNTAGPCKANKHYMVSPLERFDLQEILMLIDQEKYFVLHAPRQTGKTTSMLALADHLNAEGQYQALYMNVEGAQAARENIYSGIRTVLNEMGERLETLTENSSIKKLWPQILEERGETSALNTVLSHWAKTCAKPVILIIDEIDSLIGDTLISVLRQIRSGYDKRPENFPQSIILCGVRDVRDYRIHPDKDKSIITGGSAFNIKAKSLRLGDFSREEITNLLMQHTEKTGQSFNEDAVNCIWNFTQGQPWLVSALAYETCFEEKKGRDRSKPITAEMVIQARENLILRRETHLDQLADKLREGRVKKVIEPVLNGLHQLSVISADDLDYVYDLGLIRRKPHVDVANPIYREIIPRMLVSTAQEMMPFETAWYVKKEDGSLDMEKLLNAFQKFFREHSEHWIERFDYKEAGPQLLLQAFLQRIVNSGGRIEREYGLGRMRTDLLVIWNNKLTKQTQQTVIELKILYKSLEKTIELGLEQTHAYMDRCNSPQGHLVIFNRQKDVPWDKKIFMEKKRLKDKSILVWGM